MRIVFSGAQGVGKSTLGNIIKNDFPNYAYYDSLAREVINSKEDIKQDPKMFQARVSIYCFEKYLKDNYISTRGLADTYGYCMSLFKGECLYKDLADFSLDLQNLIAKDTILFYVPITFQNIEKKELRSTDKEFQERVDYYIQEFLDSYTGFYHKIESLSVEDRIQEIREVLKSKKGL